jgi:hypothetical protein
MKPTSQILRKAGDVLRERGWNRGWFVSQLTGGVCLIGACNVAVDGDPKGHGTANKMPEILDLLDAVTGPLSRRATWNDAEDRTADEVCVALDAAYVLALQEEGIDPEDVL